MRGFVVSGVQKAAPGVQRGHDVPLPQVSLGTGDGLAENPVTLHWEAHVFTRLKSIFSTSGGNSSADNDIRLNVYATVSPLPKPTFPHALLGERDLSDPELHGHLEGFIGYTLSRGDGEMTHTRYHVMRHLQRVQHHVSLMLSSSALPEFARWACQANAIVFDDDGRICDPEGRVLIDSQGAGDPAAELPYPADALERKSRSEARLLADGIALSGSLPPIISENEVQWRTADEVAGRVMALLAVSAFAEGIRDNDPLDLGQIRERLPAAFSYFSQAEQAFLQAATPDTHVVTQMGWRYESTAILAWAAGLWPELPSPGEICDVSGLTGHLLDASAHGLPPPHGLRPANEILDALDETIRWHWVIREAELGRREFPPNVIPGVIRERHHALNWLVRFERADWDDVTTPT